MTSFPRGWHRGGGFGGENGIKCFTSTEIDTVGAPGDSAILLEFGR